MTDNWFHTAARVEMLAALISALDHRDQVMAIVESAVDETAAQTALIEQFGLSEVGATTVLDMQVRRFTGHGRMRIVDEWAELSAEL